MTDAPSQETWDKAGTHAASVAGFDCSEPCWDPFSFEIDGFEFNAELHALHGPGVGEIEVTWDTQGCRRYDEDGCETDVLS